MSKVKSALDFDVGQGEKFIESKHLWSAEAASERRSRYERDRTRLRYGAHKKERRDLDPSSVIKVV